jgi:hypothetical protein
MTAMLGKLHTLSFELSEASWVLGQSFLDAARALEGVRICVAGTPAQRKKLAKAATILIGKASRLPTKLNELKTATNELVGAVKLAQENPHATAKDIATHLEIGRTMAANRGAKAVLPHDGTAEERIALFTETIEKKVKAFTDPGEQMDPVAIFTACYKACGGKGQPLRAGQRQQVRLREREERKASTK